MKYDLHFKTDQGEVVVRKIFKDKMSDKRRAEVKKIYLDRRNWELKKCVEVSGK